MDLGVRGRQRRHRPEPGDRRRRFEIDLLMAARTLGLAASVLLVLAACDEPKPRAAPPPGGPPAMQPKPPPPGASTGLTRRPEPAGVAVDFLNEAQAPAATPATIAAGPVELAGFAYDPVSKTPGKAVDVVIDGAPHVAVYGSPRPDVARMLDAPALNAIGFVLKLPAGVVGPGDHVLTVRVIAADGSGYTESAPIAFTAR